MRRLTALLEPVRRRLAPAVRILTPALRTLTPAGRGVLLLTVVVWVLGWRLGWDEMLLVAATGLVLLAGCALFMAGRTQLEVSLDVEPPRVTVGEAVAGSLAVTNRARTPALPFVLELPVGEGGVAFSYPLMGPGSTQEEIFVVPTEKRGVIDVGPATSVRGDPVGLFRRDLAWSEVTEIFVHPRIVPLEPLGTGLMRDLEGVTSANVSMSDLAFHALREYSPGDDLRHVHWRSSARHGKLLVRQFLDTRRSHLTIVVDSRAASYRSDEDYETAISVAGSLLVRALLDEYDASFASGRHAASKVLGKAVLDVCARAETSPESLVSVAREANRIAPETSFAVLVSGPHTDFLELQRSAGQFGIDVAKIAVRVDHELTPALRTAGDLPLLTLGRLEELPPLLHWGIG
ncbi:DUF58 domain-containing protein [Nocardioides sp. L-11A]|uniref:DUF58 domain-containing protein n=1 Tax=Nocardioides sp. L-11A TaxID=3043848 RepID=UPI00249AA2AD|nr:DUF58 domain-containing protein [Nocardioides sp. L-11A]